MRHQLDEAEQAKEAKDAALKEQAANFQALEEAAVMKFERTHAEFKKVVDDLERCGEVVDKHNAQQMVLLEGQLQHVRCLLCLQTSNPYSAGMESVISPCQYSPGTQLCMGSHVLRITGMLPKCTGHQDWQQASPSALGTAYARAISPTRADVQCKADQIFGPQLLFFKDKQVEMGLSTEDGKEAGQSELATQQGLDSATGVQGSQDMNDTSVLQLP